MFAMRHVFDIARFEVRTMITLARTAIRRLPTVETVCHRLDWCAGIAALAYLATALCLGRFPWM